MLQVDKRRLIGAAKESIKHEAEEIFEDGLDLATKDVEDVIGSATRPLSRLTSVGDPDGGEGFYSAGTWGAFFEDLHNPDTATDTVTMPELQIALGI